MNINTFDFDLPKHLIAQTPLQKRDASRLLVVDRQAKSFWHNKFANIIDYMQAGDCLVLNDTRVLPARLHGVKKDTGANIEILLLTEQAPDRWEVLAKPARKLPKGATLVFGDHVLKATCVGEKEQGKRILEFTYDGVFYEQLEKLGEMPLPPYIKQTLTDQERYQTVFARERGSAAAPTAGLHFTDDMLEKIAQEGIQIAYLTLHVGLGTFRPVTVENIEDHQMHAENYYLSEKAAELLNETKQSGGKIFAVGTTSARVLETVAEKSQGKFTATSGWTNIFIYPPYEFQAVDGLLTNFHLPKSTLIMLVSALAGTDLTLRAYTDAIKKEYRFFSFGDAMLILPTKDDQ